MLHLNSLAYSCCGEGGASLGVDARHDMVGGTSVDKWEGSEHGGIVQVGLWSGGVS